MTDVVYPVGNGSKWKDNELKYSLRSLYKYVKGIGKVFIIGCRPVFLNDDIIYIEYADRDEQKENNTLNKVLHVCDDEILSDDFIYMNDDIFFLEEIEVIPPIYKGTLQEVSQRLNPFKRYTQVINNTLRYLSDKDYGTIDYEVHQPVVFNKSIFKSIFKEFPDEYKPITMKSIYFNLFAKAYGNAFYAKKLIDMKVNIPLSAQQISNELKGKPFFSVGDLGLNQEMKQFLERTYPDASCFENIAQHT